MRRRTFLSNSGLAGAGMMIPIKGLRGLSKPKYKMGLQLYSVNDDMNRDPLGTLRAVKEMGYEDFEIYGFDADQVAYYGIDAVEFRSVLDDMQLTVSSGHYRFADLWDASDDDLARFVDQCIKGARALGSPYITWPWMAPEHRNLEGFRALAQKLNAIGEQVTAAGLGFAYHNHGYEFEDRNGESGYEIILRDTDPEILKLQMDMYWVVHEGLSTPKELVDLLPGRFVMWHIKDMDKKTRDYTELGNGSIDYTNILPDPKKSGLEFCYIEQGGNFAESPLESAATSARYYKKHLQKYL